MLKLAFQKTAWAILAIIISQAHFVQAEQRCDLGDLVFDAKPDHVLSEILTDDAVKFEADKSLVSEKLLKNLLPFLQQRKIQIQNVTEKDFAQMYYLIDVNGDSPMNRLACQVYKEWKTILTVNPTLNEFAEGAFLGRGLENIEGQLHLRTWNDGPATIYHELLHAYLTHKNYQGVVTPLSIYYFRDHSLEPHDIPYGNYLSGQEFATYTFQAGIFSDTAEYSIEALLNLSKIAKEFQQDDPSSTQVLTKTHEFNIEMVGLKLISGDFYVPKKELEKQNISKEKYHDYLVNKLNQTIGIGQKIYNILSAFAEKTEFSYKSMSIKPGLSQAQRTDLITQIREAIFAKHIEKGGFLFDFVQWTNLTWQRLQPL